MMFVVSYTLNPARPNQELVDELRKAPGWAHYFDATWLIATDENVDQLYERLRTKFVATDSFIIIEVRAGAQYHGWFPQEFWDWITETTNKGWTRP